MPANGYAAYANARAEAELLQGVSAIDALAESLENSIDSIEERSTPFMDWSLRVPTQRGGTLDFKRFPFQEEMYRTTTDIYDMVVMKSTQIGISEWLARWGMYWADRGLTCLYVFPKQAQVYDFSDSRVRTLIGASDYLRRKVPMSHVQNKGLKQIGAGFIYFRGSEASDQLESVNADCLALDEYDLLKAENVPVAEQRISGSQNPMIRRIGVPMIESVGVAAHYEESDQRRWFVKCGSCNERQTISFHDNVDLARAIRICAKCGKSLEPYISEGQWVAKYPDREKRGYHATRLIVPDPTKLGANLPRVIAESQKREPYLVENFYRRYLGEPFVHESGRLSKKIIEAAVRGYAMEDGYVGGGVVTMGVDVASARALNVRISLHRPDERRKGALWIGEAESFDDVALLIERYDVKMVVVDHMPEQRLARALQSRFPGRVYLVRYAGPQAVKVFDLDEELGVITIRRTEAIDAALNMIREQRNELPLNRPEDYDQHLMNVIRFTEKDDLDKVTVGYRSHGPDDYVHAETYDLVAYEAWMVRMAVEDAMDERETALDDLMEFRRSNIPEDPDEVLWSPGVRQMQDEEYSPGYDPNRWD
jgi:hypothetical protein